MCAVSKSTFDADLIDTTRHLLMLQIIIANYFFTAAFTIEVLLQSIAKNVIIGPNGKPPVVPSSLHNQRQTCSLFRPWAWQQLCVCSHLHDTTDHSLLA